MNKEWIVLSSVTDFQATCPQSIAQPKLVRLNLLIKFDNCFTYLEFLLLLSVCLFRSSQLEAGWTIQFRFVYNVFIFPSLCAVLVVITRFSHTLCCDAQSLGCETSKELCNPSGQECYPPGQHLSLGCAGDKIHGLEIANRLYNYIFHYS